LPVICLFIWKFTLEWWTFADARISFRFSWNLFFINNCLRSNLIINVSDCFLNEKKSSKNVDCSNEIGVRIPDNRQFGIVIFWVVPFILGYGIVMITKHYRFIIYRYDHLAESAGHHAARRPTAHNYEVVLLVRQAHIRCPATRVFDVALWPDEHLQQAHEQHERRPTTSAGQRRSRLGHRAVATAAHPGCVSWAAAVVIFLILLYRLFGWKTKGLQRVSILYIYVRKWCNQRHVKFG